MPTLDDKQRAWLDAALKAKGRFTRKKSIEKDWEEYRRRRAKTATALEDLAAAAPQRQIVEQALKDADALAETGKFSNAYKALDRAKKLAKTTSGKRLDAIATATLDAAAQDIRQKLNSIFPRADYAVSQCGALSRKLDATKKVADEPTLEAAIARRKAVVDEEAALLADLARVTAEAKDAIGRIAANRPREAIAAAEEKIAMFERAGLGAQIAARKQDIADMKVECEEFGGRYADVSVLRGLLSAATADYKAKMLAIKSFGPYQKQANDGGVDAKTDNAREDLKPLDPDAMADVEARAEARLKAVETSLGVDAALDQLRLTFDTDLGDIDTAPELPKFDAAAAFGDLLDDEVPDDITRDETDALVAKASAKMLTFVQNVPADSPQLFDLMMMSKTELAKMANGALTGVDSPKGISESHKLMLAKMTEELGQIIRDNCPNAMKDDLSEITIGGEKYLRDKDLGSGNFGTARRFCKASDPSVTIVVKSLDCPTEDPDIWNERRDAMAAEMRTNMRLSQVDDGNPGADNLLAMSGAAVSGDGTLHMVMEDAEAGDISDFGENISALTAAGILPPEARDALAQDLIRQTVMGMKAMEARGLVHNDMKPENMLLRADGSLKIMDFGESRFGDASGQIPNYKSANEVGEGFGFTEGYVPPEQFEKGGATVTSKVDVFALGGIAKVLGLQDYNPENRFESQKPATALGRMVEAASSLKADERPSLDAILASSLLQANDNDFAKEDLDDLRRASTEMSMSMSVVRASVGAENLEMPDLFADDEEAEEYKRLRKQVEDIVATIKTDNAKLADMQKAIMVLRQDHTKQLEMLATDKPDNAKMHRECADTLKKALDFFSDKMQQAIQGAKAEGQNQIDALKGDDSQKIDVPGVGGGSFTVKDALKKRETLDVEIRRMQDDFYALSAADPETALAHLDGTNQRLQEMADQIAAIDAGLKAKVGPEGKFLLAEQKLADIGARFGPSRAKRADADGRKTPAPDATDDEDDRPYDEDDMKRTMAMGEVVDEIEKRARG